MMEINSLILKWRRVSLSDFELLLYNIIESRVYCAFSEFHVENNTVVTSEVKSVEHDVEKVYEEMVDNCKDPCSDHEY